MNLSRSAVLLIVVSLIIVVNTSSAIALEILYTGCTNATFENCRCPSDPLGAMEKRTLEIERRRELGEVILVDSGDFMPALNDSLTSRFVIEAMEYAGYDAIGLGDQELRQGEKVIRQICERLPVICANVVYLDGTPLAPPLRIVERKNSKYAITSLLNPDALKFIDPNDVQYIKVLDPDSMLVVVKGLVPGNAKLIVLSHAGNEHDRKNSKKWKDVDLIVGGHSQTVIEGVEDKYPVPIVQAGGNARYLGVAAFRGPKVRAELISMRYELPDDKRITDLVLRLKKARFHAKHNE